MAPRLEGEVQGDELLGGELVACVDHLLGLHRVRRPEDYTRMSARVIFY